MEAAARWVGVAAKVAVRVVSRRSRPSSSPCCCQLPVPFQVPVPSALLQEDRRWRCRRHRRRCCRRCRRRCCLTERCVSCRWRWLTWLFCRYACYVFRAVTNTLRTRLCNSSGNRSRSTFHRGRSQAPFTGAVHKIFRKVPFTTCRSPIIRPTVKPQTIWPMALWAMAQMCRDTRRPWRARCTRRAAIGAR